MRNVKVSVPATTANLGPGFDCLGLALELHNTVEMQVGGRGLDIQVHGEEANTLPADETNMVVQSAYRMFDAVGHKRPDGLIIRCFNRIPARSGMGSSAAAIVSGMAAANELLPKPLSKAGLLRTATKQEGHPDNVAAAVLGALTVSSRVDQRLLFRRIEMPHMKVVIAMPDVQVSTEAARSILPDTIPFADAAANIGRAVLVVQALQFGDYDLLSSAAIDRMHVPYRKLSIPGYDSASRAAQAEGAAAVTISGSGPSVVAFAPRNHQAIAFAMVNAFKEATGKAARAWVLPIDQTGVRSSDDAE